MFIKLRRGWFDPNGNRRRVEDNPHEVPDEWKEVIPSTAEVLSAKEVKVEEAPKPSSKK